MTNFIVPATMVRKSNNLRILRVNNQGDAQRLWNQLRKNGLNAQFKKGKKTQQWYVRCWK